MKHLLLVGLLALSSNTFAGFIDVDASFSGAYDNSGSGNGIISGAPAGDGVYRNWIGFDLTSVTENIVSASLTIYNHGFNDDGIEFTWTDIRSRASDVLRGTVDGMDMYNDLIDGPTYATGTTVSGQNNVFDLTEAALSSINSASSYWFMGGSTENDLGLAYGFTNGVSSGDLIRLTLETQANIAAVPVPAALWLFGSGLIGVVGVARRKQH